MASGGRRGSLIFLITTLFLLISSPSSSASTSTIPQLDRSFYDLCAPFNCSNITFSFPFSPSESFGSRQFDCGLPRFRIACDAASVASIELSGRFYQVKELYRPDSIITVVDSLLAKDVESGNCKSLQNLTIPSSPNNDVAGAALALPLGAVNLTILRCPLTLVLPGEVRGGVSRNYSCKDENSVSYLWTPRVPRAVPTPIGCDHFALPVSGAKSLINLLNQNGGGGVAEIVAELLGTGFQLQWPNLTDCVNCQQTGGRCGYDGSTKRIECFCEGRCTKKRIKWKIIIGATAGSISALLVMLLILFFNYKGRCSEIFKRSYYDKSETRGDEKKAKEFIKEYQSTILTNYSYNDVKKIANGFREKLGEGGYGKVFKGRLPDGRLVAVKMLENYQDNNSNFLNEVNTIGRIHHVNVIRLFGFCWDGAKQALIYEYMPNKSLGDLRSVEGGRSISLGLPRLLEIAVGVAHGLEYLHNSCDSRILHLDIKPQNVLLDHNLNPKISDFGLAKVYSRNQSAVAMTGGARGTIGYIAPEIFLRNLGNPSHKSDVYSFGMLLFEMVGATRRQVEHELESSSETYFPGWVYDRLVQEIEMEVADDVIVEEDLAIIQRKMVMVGLWCIQMNPRDRPSMIQVAEMLDSNVESIKMPPKPFSFSLPRVHTDPHESGSVESEYPELPLTSGSQSTSNKTIDLL